MCLIGLSALWLQSESVGMLVAYLLLCPLACAISTLAMAHYAPGLQEKLEGSWDLAEESNPNSVPNTASIAALSLKVSIALSLTHL